MLGPSTRPPCGVGNEAWRLFVTQNLPSALQPLCIGSLPWCRAQPYSRLSQLSIRYANGIPPVQALSTCRTTSDELQPTSAASKTTHDTILVFNSLTPLYREPNSAKQQLLKNACWPRNTSVPARHLHSTPTAQSHAWARHFGTCPRSCRTVKAFATSARTLRGPGTTCTWGQVSHKPQPTRSVVVGRLPPSADCGDGRLRGISPDHARAFDDQAWLTR